MATEGKNSIGSKVSEKIKDVLKKITRSSKKSVEEPIHGSLEDVMKPKKGNKKGKSTESKTAKPKKSFKDADFFKKLKAKLTPNAKSKVEDLYSKVSKTSKLNSKIVPQSAKGSENPPPVPPRRYSLSELSVTNPTDVPPKKPPPVPPKRYSVSEVGVTNPPAVPPKKPPRVQAQKKEVIYADLDLSGKTATTQKIPLKTEDSVVYSSIDHNASKTKDVMPKARPRNPPPPVPVRGDLHSIASQSRLPDSVKQSSSPYSESKGSINYGKNTERGR